MKIKRFGIQIVKINYEVEKMERSLLYWRIRSFFEALKRITLVKHPVGINTKDGWRQLETFYRLIIPIIKVRKKACDTV